MRELLLDMPRTMESGEIVSVNHFGDVLEMLEHGEMAAWERVAVSDDEWGSD